MCTWHCHNLAWRSGHCSATFHAYALHDYILLLPSLYERTWEPKIHYSIVAHFLFDMHGDVLLQLLWPQFRLCLPKINKSENTFFSLTTSSKDFPHGSEISCCSSVVFKSRCSRGHWTVVWHHHDHYMEWRCWYCSNHLRTSVLRVHVCLFLSIYERTREPEILYTTGTPFLVDIRGYVLLQLLWPQLHGLPKINKSENSFF